MNILYILVRYFWDGSLVIESSPSEYKEHNTARERTKVLHGEQNVVNTFLQFVSNAHNRIDACIDSRPPLAIEIGQHKNAFLNAKSRGVKLRYITEITEGNVSYCKELMKIVDELRHVEGIKGNFYVSETEYIAPDALHENGKTASIIIYSNLRELVEHQQQYVFDSFWSRAISAQRKIKEIEDKDEDTEHYQTKLLENAEQICEKIKNIINTLEEDDWSISSTFDGLLMMTNTKEFEIEGRLSDCTKRGKNIRWVGIITKDNSNLIKTFIGLGMKIKHAKNIPPINFAVSSKELHATIDEMKYGQIPDNLLTSNRPSYVNHYKSIFEELWKNGVDAVDRIKDIEQDVESANIDIIQNPKESIKLVYQLISSAKEEVLVLFSTANTFRRQVRMGGIQNLKKAVDEHNISVRVLVPFDKEALQSIKKEEDLSPLFYDSHQQRHQHQRQQAAPQIDIRTIDKSLETKITMVITDRKRVMIWELKDDTKDSSYDAAGIAAHSDSRSIVSSYFAIFENLWKQSELYRELTKAHEQLEIHDKMQKEFINIAAHELRTPIQPIIGLSDLLLFKKGDIGQYRRLIDVINKNAKRLITLTENLLDITKIEGQMLQLKIEQFDLNDVISNAMADCRSQIKKNNNKIKIKLISKAKDVFVRADRTRIYQVITNLLSNAIKFSQQGGTIIIMVEKQAPGTNNNNQILVKVKDTGEGIDAQIFPTLFTKFAAKSQPQGTGLGLFICKGIIEAHGGRIWAENNNLNNGEKGAAFYFSLPVLSVQQH